MQVMVASGKAYLGCVHVESGEGERNVLWLGIYFSLLL